MTVSITAGAGFGGPNILPGQAYRHLPLPLSLPFRHRLLFPPRRRVSHMVSAKRFSSRTGRVDTKSKGSATTIKEEEGGEEQTQQWRRAEEDEGGSQGGSGAAVESAAVVGDDFDDGLVLPELPGSEPDFWEGPQWDGLGFFVQYMWAFGVGFALIACGIAAFTYNQGATDFKETPAYRQSVQSQGLFEDPEGSNSDVFESNPTEEAPSLE